MQSKLQKSLAFLSEEVEERRSSSERREEINDRVLEIEDGPDELVVPLETRLRPARVAQAERRARDERGDDGVDGRHEPRAKGALPDEGSCGRSDVEEEKHARGHVGDIFRTLRDRERLYPVRPIPFNVREV